MNQADVVEQKVKPQRVVIEPSVVVESEVKPTTPLDIDWESLLKSIDETKSKIELKKIFDENAALLDTVIPNTTESLRSVILDKKDILSV